MLTKPEGSKKLFSTAELGGFWMNDLAYIKPITMSGKQCYAIHSADGTPLAVAEQRDLAFAAARQNELNPASLH